MNTTIKKLIAVSTTAGFIMLSGYSAMAEGVVQKIKHEMKEEMHGNKITSEQAAKVKVNIVDAITKAQAVQKGTVIKASLKSHDDKLVYVVKFIDSDKKSVVIVDAITGEAKVAEKKEKEKEEDDKNEKEKD